MQPSKTSSAQNDAPVSLPASKPRQNKKKPAMIAAIAGVVVLIIALVCLYFFWYQNPQKVVTDAVANAVNAKQTAAKGSMVVKMKGGGDVKIDFNGEGDQKVGKADLTIDVNSNGVKFKATGNFIAAENGDYYVRANNVQQAVDMMVEQMISSFMTAETPPEAKDQAKQMFKQQFDPIVAKIDNKCIHITAADAREANKDLEKLQTCLNEVRTMVREDKDTTRELASAYKQHQFVRIDKELGSKDGALGYQVSIDEGVSKKFGEATKDSKIAKKIKSCSNESSDTTRNDSTDSSKVTSEKTEVWVNRWSHTLQKLSTDVTDDGTNTKLDVKFDYGKKPAVEVPQGATPLKDVMKEIEALMPQDSVVAS